MPRRPMTKSAKIRRAILRGMTPAAIAERYNTTLSTVYNLKAGMKRRNPELFESQTETTIITPPPPAQAQGLATLSKAPAEGRVEISAGVEPQGIIRLVPQEGAAHMRVHSHAEVPEVVSAVQAPPPSLWARFKLWAFGVRA